MCIHGVLQGDERSDVDSGIQVDGDGTLESGEQLVGVSYWAVREHRLSTGVNAEAERTGAANTGAIDQGRGY